MKAKQAENRAPKKSGNANRDENNAADKIEDSMTKLSLGKKEGGADDHAEADFTPDEAEALQKLLAADTAQSAPGEDKDRGKDGDGGDEGDSDAGQADDSSGGTRNNAKPSDQRHPRLERQVFVGGLPVDVTSTLFRTWADSVFAGRVINAVLVVDRLTHSRSRGFGFITFDAVEVAEAAANQRMFSFGERMVEIKRAQNLNSRNKQQQAQTQDAAAAARGRGIKPQLNGRSNRFNVGRGGVPQGPVPPRGSNAASVAAPQAGAALGNRPGAGVGAGAGAGAAGALAGVGVGARNMSHQYPAGSAAMHAKYQGPRGNGATNWRHNKAMSPHWIAPHQAGRGRRVGGRGWGGQFVGPDTYSAQVDCVPGGAGEYVPPPGWFPGMTHEQMMGGYYLFHMYPDGRGRGMMPRVPAGPGPYATPWQGPLPGDAALMGAPNFFGPSPQGLYFAPVPPGMEMAMMGMPPPYMGMMGQEFGRDDYDEAQGEEEEEAATTTEEQVSKEAHPQPVAN